MAAFVKNPALARKLAALGIHTVEDLLYYFPYRYDDFSRVVPIRNLKFGDTVAVEGTIKEAKVIRIWKQHSQLLETEVEDASGSIRVVWFNQLYLARMLKKGVRVALAGKVYEGKRGKYFANPAYEIAQEGEKKSLHTRRMVPVYRQTPGLTSRWLRTLVDRAMPAAADMPEILPEEVLLRERFLSPADALRAIHFPKDHEEADEARRRFQFEQLFLFQVRFIREQKGRERIKARVIPFDQSLIKAFVDTLPFKLTDDQRKAAWQILQDIARPYPMQRLLEGDVGSGKTIVSFLAVLEAVKAGFQAMLMAPTEVLAKQHFLSAGKILARHAITIGLATASSYALGVSEEGEMREKKITKRTFQAMLKEGDIHFAIGTHALLSQGLAARDLALAIVDEQHRFGIEQRAKLLKKTGEGRAPHFLSMSATPIPRTLALAVYGDLDISRIVEMPKNRQSIETRVVPPAKRSEAYAFIRSEAEKGRQAFVICPRIDSAAPPDAAADAKGAHADGRRKIWSDVKAVKDEYEKLSKTVFPDLRIAMLHGKLKPKEKEGVMRKFAAGEFDILVSTSVVEVGIDVPNASVIAIEGADRFGLATLHQFRGRVGRGEHKSYCLLLSDSAGAESNARLRALVGAKNGFELAQIDLELRGPGEFLGEEQSGMPDIAMEALRNQTLIEHAREDAKKICEEDPGLERHPALGEKLKKLAQRVHGE